MQHACWANAVTWPPLKNDVHLIRPDEIASCLEWMQESSSAVWFQFTKQCLFSWAFDRYRKGMIPGSINIPFTTAFSPEGELSPCPAVNTLNSRRNQVVVVIGNRGRNAANVSWNQNPNFKKKVLNNLLFMAPHLISAWNAYEDLKIRLFRHTHTRTHTHAHAHTHTQPLHYKYMHYRWWVGR